MLKETVEVPSVKATVEAAPSNLEELQISSIVQTECKKAQKFLSELTGHWQEYVSTIL